MYTACTVIGAWPGWASGGTAMCQLALMTSPLRTWPGMTVGTAVAVPVMKIRIVGTGMDHRLMPVPMRMRLRDRPIMLVLVMLIMGMAVFMFEHVVLVFMFMPFSKMHP